MFDGPSSAVTTKECSTLLELPWPIFAQLWPAERVVLGRRVCKELHANLHEHIRTVLFKFRHGGTSWREGRMAQDAARFRASSVAFFWNENGLGGEFFTLVNVLRPALRRLHITPKQALTGDEADQLADVLRGHGELKLFELHDCDLGYPARTLLKALGTCKSLTDLRLTHGSVGYQAGSLSLSEVLGECTALSRLDLTESNLAAPGAASLADLLFKCSELTHLSLARNLLGFSAFPALAEALGRCSRLQHLDLSENQIGARGGRVLAEALRECPLVHLGLKEVGLGDEGVAALAHGVHGVLHKMTTLAHLDLGANSIGQEGAAALAAGVGACSGLRDLDLSWNDFDEDDGQAEGLEQLLCALRGCEALARLSLRAVSLGPRGLGALSALGGGSVREIDLAENGIDAEGATHVGALVAASTALREVDLDDNAVEEQGLAVLLRAVASRSTALRRLRLRGNWISGEESDAAALARMLAATPSLTEVDLRDNDVDDAVVRALAAAGLSERVLLGERSTVEEEETASD